MKRIALVVLVVLVVAGGALWWALGSLDALVERTIEETGSELLGARLRVAGVDVDLAEGRVTLRGLEADNPQGEGLAFSRGPAFSFGEVTAALDLEALSTEGPIPLTLVRVAEPVVNAEVTPAGINLDVLRRNVAAATPAAPEGAAEDVRLRIDRLEFQDGLLRADSRAVGGNENDLELPSMQLEGLGGREGMTPAELGRRVLDTFLARAVRQVARDRLSGEVEEQLESLKEKASGALRSILGVERSDEAD